MIQVSISETQILIPIRVTPKGGRDCILPYSGNDTVIRLKVSVPPEDGKANKAVIELLMDVLDLSKSRLHIVRGEKSREKQVAISLRSSEEAKEIIEKLNLALGRVNNSFEFNWL